MAEKTFPASARCATCRHPRSFHPDGGPCKANHRDRTGCEGFVGRPGQTLVPILPPAEQLAAALDTVMTAIEHAAGTPGARKAAAALGTVVMEVPSLRIIADADLTERMRTCLETPALHEDAEVTDDAESQGKHPPRP